MKLAFKSAKFAHKFAKLATKFANKFAVLSSGRVFVKTKKALPNVHGVWTLSRAFGD